MVPSTPFDVRREAQRDRGDVPRHITDVIRRSRHRLLGGLADLFQLGGEAHDLVDTHELLERPRESLIVFRPRRQAHGLDVLVHRQRGWVC